MRGILKVWVAGKPGEGLIQLLRHLMGINPKLLEHLRHNAIGLLHQRQEQVFNFKLDVVAPANFATRRFLGSLNRSSEAVNRKGGVWFNTAGTNITGLDGLKEGFKRRVRNAERTASFDGTQATIIDPIVDDLTGNLQVRSNIVGGKVIGSHGLSW
jgi:hypothetical protein